MTHERTIEDRLREEYFDLLPEIQRVAEHLEAEMRYAILPICHNLEMYERLEVSSRVKECESALNSLRRRQEGGTFDRDQPAQFTLTSLNDLAGVRVLAFPRSRIVDANKVLRERFATWVADPVPSYPGSDQPLAFKYYGTCDASRKIRGEIQIVSALVGHFWEVEHSAIYKPSPRLKGIASHDEMRRRAFEVYNALRAFEEEFEKLVRAGRT